MTKTKAIIFDLNGVFILEPKMSDRVNEAFGVSIEEFLSALSEVMPQARMPNSPSYYKLWKPYMEKWGMDLTEEKFYYFGFKAAKANEKLIKIAQELKVKGLKLFILSNNFKERTAYYNQNFPFLKKLFNKVYYSWQTGFVKTSAEAYKNLLDKNNLKPEECLYFDDSESNVELANSLGIKSFVFENEEQVRQVLKDNQVIT
tara:strand:- start:812 stop:1417 length:606 start_codon:yes stop_codon:yes gene_type:complete